MIEWGAGRGSMHDVHHRMYGPAHIGLHVTGHGGGVVDNAWIWGADLGSRIWGQNRFPPPEKNGLVLSIEMGCADTVPFPREPNTPF